MCRSRTRCRFPPRALALLLPSTATRVCAGETENVCRLYGDRRRCGVYRAATPPDQNLASAAAFQPALRGDDRPVLASLTGASADARPGHPLHVVSEILGHASITITKDVHGHLVGGGRRAVAASMSHALRWGTPCLSLIMLYWLLTVT